MTLRSGLASSAGLGDEASWGVPVAPTVFVPLVDESLTAEIERLESEGIIAGQRVLRSQQWEEAGITAAGDLGFELNDQSKGLLLKHMFGGASLTGPFTPSDLGGLGMTVQVGVPQSGDGTVRPKTIAGGKVGSWELGLSAGEIATLGLSIMGRHVIGLRTVADGVTTATSAAITSATAAWSQDDVGKPISGAGIPAGTTILSVTSATAATLSANATATGASVTFTIGLALTAPTYATSIRPMSYVNGALSIGGVATKVTNITVSGDNGLADDRVFVGQRTIDEPLEMQLREYSGQIETEYFSDVAYNRFVAGSESALSLTIARGTKSLVITGNVRFDGETPQVSGRGIVGQTLPFTFVGSTTDASAITATLVE